METITQEQLKSVLSYDAETGEFTRISFSGNRCAGAARIGLLPNKPDERGYLRIRVYGKKYRAHRLAWLYVHGRFPEKGLDHINGDKLDNRIANLREADQLQNMQNRSPNRTSTSKLLGVSKYLPLNKWKAQIMVAGKQLSLGYFNDEQEAHVAYLEAKSRLHTFNPIPRELTA
jgi:hypothetical protein